MDATTFPNLILTNSQAVARAACIENNFRKTTVARANVDPRHLRAAVPVDKVWESGCGAMYNPDDKGP